MQGCFILREVEDRSGNERPECPETDPFGSACVFIPVSQIIGDQSELLQRRLKLFDNLSGDDARLGKVFGGFEAFVFEPKDIEARLIAADQFVIVVGAPAAVGILLGPGRLALVAVLRVVAGDEFVEVFAFQRMGLEGEVHVGPEVVDPKLLCPGGLAAGFLVEEENVRLHPLGVEEAGRKAEQRVDVAFVEELAADRLTGASFKEDVIGNDDCGASVCLQQRLHMLEEVELFVGGRRPEVVPLVGFLFLRNLSFRADNGDAAFLPERGIGEDNIEALSRIFRQRIADDDRHVPFAPNAVKQKVHRADPRRSVDDFPTFEDFPLESSLFRLSEVGIVMKQVIVRGEQESAGAARRIADRLIRLGGNRIDHRFDQRPRGKVLTGSRFDVLRIFLQQTFISVAFHVGAHSRPVFPIDQILDEALQPRGGLEFVLGFAEDQPEQALLSAEVFENVAVVIE